MPQTASAADPPPSGPRRFRRRCVTVGGISKCGAKRNEGRKPWRGPGDGSVGSGCTLPHGDVRTSERMQAEAGEVAAASAAAILSAFRTPESHQAGASFPAAGVVLRENPIVRMRDSLRRDPHLCTAPPARRAPALACCSSSSARPRRHGNAVARSGWCPSSDRSASVAGRLPRRSACRCRGTSRKSAAADLRGGRTRRRSRRRRGCGPGRTVHFRPTFTHCIGLAKERGMMPHSWARVMMPLMMFRRSIIMCQEVHSCWSQSRIALLFSKSERRASFHRGRMWLSRRVRYFSRVGVASFTFGLST